MPGAYARTRPPPPATECSVSDEASRLELCLQRQLEDDVARIFDESIYTDLEVVCGKLKILTHSCILKARTNQFYHKLQTVLHANISRDNFDEIYSFVSDAYTECNIKHQEEEIVAYLDTLTILKPVPNSALIGKSDCEDTDVFVTPTCDISPSLENTFQNLTVSPSTGLIKKYYALVPIEGNILEKELIEQDTLSNAFQSLNKDNLTSLNKPSSLSLTEIFSSHNSKTVKHSGSCDALNPKNKSLNIGEKDVKELNIVPSQTCETIGGTEIQEKEVDSSYTPDSLIIDDPSSSSDYLSAAYTFSSGVCTSGPQTFNFGDIREMEQNYISSDSGLDNAGLLESLNSHKDVIVTDMPLTSSTLVADDVHDSCSSLSLAENNQQDTLPDIKNPISLSSTSVERDSNGQQATPVSKIMKDVTAAISSKEEKQRQNEEIVILESSSLSSETGSWESILLPKSVEKNICQKFMTKERQNSKFVGFKNEPENREVNCCSPFKSTSCFIDASSLVDEENASKIQIDVEEGTKSANIPAPSQPILCSTVRPDISPNDWSEGIENDDSLENSNHKDPDSIQKDLSPTIFDMTPITEDSLHTNPFEKIEQTDSGFTRNTDITRHSSYVAEKDPSLSTNTFCFTSTPNNSIMSLKVSELRCQENQIDVKSVSRESYPHLKMLKNLDFSPIVGEGASVKDHLPSTGSPLTRRKIENIPIVSGGHIPELQETSSLEKTKSKSCNTSAWVVDMSRSTTVKKPGDKNCDILKNDSKYGSLESCNKSRSSVDSDLSEKSCQRFFIDLSTLPDPLPPKKDNESESAERRNIFSIYIDFSDQSKPKEMPSRLTSKKNNGSETKTTSNMKIGNASSQIIAPDGDVSKTFEEYESLCNDPNMSVSDIIERVNIRKKCLNKGDSSKKSMQTVEEENKPRDKQRCVIENDVSINRKGESFVKLSDLDKPVEKPESSFLVKVSDVRMTRSIPDTNWAEKSAAALRSFHSENAVSLNRLFPHLKNEFSKSMPGSLSTRTRSPLRFGAAASPNEKDALNEVTSDNMSEISSVQSSICRSVVENSTTEETSQTSSLTCNSQSRLGQDLLRMFLEEIVPDVIVEVSGKRIKAHKCILSSRCQYFAGILSGGWVESAGNVIVLPPFSFNVVHFALCHIYSGVSTIPDSISIVELATIADMLGLEGLKEAIMFTLKSKYCHYFHRPCPVCTAGVLECFPLSSVYGLEDLYRKCLRWITKYFPKVWPTKAFATLPKELLDKCYQQHIVNLNTDNVIDTVYGCGITAASLQNARWAEVVGCMCRRLVSAAAQFAAARLSHVLRALAALPHDAPAPPLPAHQALDDCFAAAIEWAPPEEACRAYAFLCSIIQNIPESNSGHIKPSQNNVICVHARVWRMQCESALVRAAPRVVVTQAFKELSPDLRKRLRELGCIMYGTQVLPTTSASLHDKKSNAYKTNKNGSSITRSLDVDHVRASFVPYASKPSLSIASTEILKSNNDITDRRATSSHPPKIRTTKAQEERAKYNLIKNTQSQDRINGKALVTRLPYENTKPRYLEPKLCKENVKKTPKKVVPKNVSSSESSRNSRSPIQPCSGRASRSKPGEARAPAAPAAGGLSQDSLSTSSRPRTAEPSTESLSESHISNKYATYTKTRHTTKGSIDSATSSNGPASRQIVPDNKIKSKIPVYSNPAKKTEHVDKENTLENLHLNKTAPINSNVNRASHRNGSLMSATKSSSAKMVPKKVKDSPKGSPRSVRAMKRAQPPPPPPLPLPDIPPLERSGTFLKDEPMFGDKTIDIDQPSSPNSNEPAEKNV